MKTKMTSRLLAVLLALLLVLGTVPALAVELPVDQYEVLTDSAVDVYYERLMACTALDEFDAISMEMDDEQIVVFYEKLTPEQQANLDAKFAELVSAWEDSKIPPEEEDPNRGEIIYPTVDYTNVAPFLAPVQGAAMEHMLMMASAAEEENGNGLELTKTVSEPDENGVYTLTLEAWATGSKVISTVNKDVPTDIILVLDQSGSMDDDFKNISENFKEVTSTDLSWLYSNRSTLYIKLEDGSYSKVSVSRDSVQINGTYTVWPNQTNYTYHWSRDTLYHKCDTDNKYGVVTINTKSAVSRRYTYTCSNCGLIETSEGWTTTPNCNGHIYRLTGSTSVYEYTFSYTDIEGNTVTETVLAGENPPEWDFYQSSTTTESTKKLTALKDAVTIFTNSVAEKAKGPDGILGTEDDVDHTISVVGFASGASWNGRDYKYGNTEVFVGASQYTYGAAAREQYTNAPQSMKTTAGVDNVKKSIGALDANGGTIINLGMEMAAGIFDANPVPAGQKRNRVVVVFTDGVPGWSGFDSSVASDAIDEAYTIKNTYSATVYSVGIFDGADATSAGDAEGSDTEKANWFMQNLSSNNGKVQTPSYYLSASNANALNNIFQQIADNIEDGGSSTTLDANTVVKDVISDQFTLPEGTETSNINVYTSKVNSLTGEFETREKWDDAIIAFSEDRTAVTVTNFNFSENWVGTETNNDNVTYRGKKLIIEIPIVVKSGFMGGNGVYTNGQDSGVYENSSATDPVETFVRPTVDVEIPDVTVYAADKNVYLLGDLSADELVNGATVMCGEVPIGSDPYNNYGLEDWQNAYVDITLPAGTGESDLTDDKTYTLTATVSPKTGGNVKEKQGAATGNIYVFKPVLTFKDSTIDYMTVVSDVTAYHNAENYVSVAWKRGTVIADAVTMGPAPSLSLEYTPSNTAWVTDGKVTADSDVNVNVAAKIGNVDVSAYTSAIRKACTYCDHTSDDTEATILNSKNPEFVVHITNVLSSLTIQKTGLNVGVYSGGVDRESAIVTVTGGGKTWTVALTQDNKFKATLVGLKVGETYTVTEDTGWTWRYVSSNATQSVTISKDGNNVTINNAMSNQYWLGGDNFRVNKFAPYTANTATE